MSRNQGCSASGAAASLRLASPRGAATRGSDQEDAVDPKARYELRSGKWRPDPPHVSYDGPAIKVDGRTLARPPGADE